LCASWAEAGRVVSRKGIARRSVVRWMKDDMGRFRQL
jgi:hypothetical protein